MLRNLDFVKSLPSDLIQTSSQGGIISLVSMAFFFLILVMELGSFWSEKVIEVVEVDSDFNSQIKISFDVMMMELPCAHVQAVVNDVMGNRIEGIDDISWAEFGEDNKMLRNYTRKDKYWKDALRENGHDVEAMDDNDPEEENPVTAESKELDADWSSSHDGFKHKSFDEVIKFHDFHMVNFFAGWCSHCQVFAPKWKEIAESLDMKPQFVDETGKMAKVKFMKMNCVDFMQVCQKERIRGFPELRFYTTDGNFRSFMGPRNNEEIKNFIAKQVKGLTSREASGQALTKASRQKKQGDSTVLGKEDEKTGGCVKCRLSGWITVPKVPGEFHLMATGKYSKMNLNPMTANLSHRLFSLTIAKDGQVTKSQKDLLKEVRRLTKSGGLSSDRAEALRNAVAPALPLNVQKSDFSALKGAYIATEVGTAPQHFLQIEGHQLWTRERYYDYSMYTKTSSVKKLEESDLETYGSMREHHRVPQTRFYYRIEPLVTHYIISSRRWYDVVTNILSLIASTYLVSSGVNTGIGTIKKSFGMKAE
jgi:thiol-disulfide isomerase/thioredoxin